MPKQTRVGVHDSHYLPIVGHYLYSPVSTGEHERRLPTGCALVDDGVKVLGCGVAQAAIGRIHLLRVQRLPAVRPQRADDSGDDRGVTTGGGAVEHAAAVAEPGVVGEVWPSRETLGKR